MYEVEWIRIWDIGENEFTYNTAVEDKIVIDKDEIIIEKDHKTRIIFQKSTIISYSMPPSSKVDAPGPNSYNVGHVAILLSNMHERYYSLNELETMSEKIIIDEDEIIAYTMQPISANPLKYDKSDIIVFPKSNIVNYVIPKDVATWKPGKSGLGGLGKP